MSRLTVWTSICALVLSSVVIAGFVLAPTPGHTLLHIGCSNHNHGPVRTAGAGRRLFDAHALNRQARRLDP